MYAMILSAGRGERMLPLTKDTPKPLLKVDGKCLIDYQIERLSRAGFTDFVVNCGRFGKKIVNHLHQNCAPDHSFQFSIEGEEILETGGGIVKALPLIKSDPFVVVNADVWTDYDYRRLRLDQSALAHLVLVDNPEHNLSGDFGLDNDSYINELDNKLTFSGIGVYRKEFFQSCDQKPFRLATLLRERAKDRQVTAEVHHGLWLDIGTPERLKKLQSIKDISLQ